MNVEKIIKQISNSIKENKNYMPLLGALLGYMITSDKETKDKIVNGLIGSGLGYLVKDNIKNNEQ